MLQSLLTTFLMICTAATTANAIHTPNALAIGVVVLNALLTVRMILLEVARELRVPR
jgi:hypothetical protein